MGITLSGSDRISPLVTSILLTMAALGYSGAAIGAPTFSVPAAVDQARQLMMMDPASARPVASQLKRHAESLSPGPARALALARAKWVAAEVDLRLGRIASARVNVDAAYQSALTAPDLIARADIVATRGSVREESGDPAGALNDYLAAIRLHRNAGYARGQAVVLIYLGALYARAGDNVRAERYYRLAGEIAGSDVRLNYSVHDSIGNLYGDAERYDSASAEYRKAAVLAQKLGSAEMEVHVLSNLARNEARAERVKGARRIVARAMAISRREIGPPSEELWLTKALVEHEAGNKNAALRTLTSLKDRGGVLQNQRHGNWDFIAYHVYRAAGRPAEALHHLEIYRRLRDEATALAVSTKAALMAARFDFASQELRIAKLKGDELRRRVADERADNARWRTTFLIAGTAVLLVVALLVAGVITLRRGRNRARAMNEALEQALAEVRAREKAELAARDAAEHDALTGLSNRRHLTDSLYPKITSALDRGDRCALLLIDLDRFKPVNDNFGHEVGDAVLIEVADRLRAVGSKYDGHPARLGGDEFVMVVWVRDDLDAPRRAALDIVREVSAPYRLSDVELRLGASVGIAEFGPDGDTLVDVMRAADEALYEAKRSGRGTVVSYSSLLVDSLGSRRAGSQ